jgi:hypothetical protein
MSAQLDATQRATLALVIGSTVAGIGFVLVVQGIGLIAGPEDLLTRGLYGAGGVALLSFGWLFLARTLVELVRQGAVQAREQA